MLLAVLMTCLCASTSSRGTSCRRGSFNTASKQYVHHARCPFACHVSHALVAQLGVSLSNDDCEYLVDKYGSRGRLNYTQFINMYENVTTQRETAYNAAYSGTLVDAPTCVIGVAI